MSAPERKLIDAFSLFPGNQMVGGNESSVVQSPMEGEVTSMAEGYSKDAIDAKFQALRQEFRADLAHEVGTLRTEMAVEFGKVRTELRDVEGRLAREIKDVEIKVVREIGDVRGDIKVLGNQFKTFVWIAGPALAALLAGMVKLIFFPGH